MKHVASIKDSVIGKVEVNHLDGDGKSWSMRFPSVLLVNNMNGKLVRKVGLSEQIYDNCRNRTQSKMKYKSV